MSNQPSHDLDPRGPAGKGDCHCNDTRDASALDPTAAELLSAEELDQQLRVALEADAAFETPAFDLSVAEQDLADVEDLALRDLEGVGLPDLQNIVDLAQRYPGLKITFSF